MATRSQRKKEKHKKKRQKKKEARKRQGAFQQTAEIPSSINARHRQRLSKQTPQAWPGELLEDTAVFDEAAWASLPAESAEQAAAVRQALEEACDSRGEDALKRVASIPRSSPLSEWRLFVRGLVSWLAEERDEASEAWKRLDPERRPGRIAIAMMSALRTDLENVSLPSGTGGTGGETQAEWSNRLDERLLYHAKLLRRVRFDRAALRIAAAGLSAPEESEELLLGPRKMRWLKRFAEEYRDTEPDLTAALEQAALGRAFAQDFSDLFQDAVRWFKGPRHDRRNLLLSYFYLSRFRDASAERRAERSLAEFLRTDLPRNHNLSEPLRAAIASQIHLEEANLLIQSPGGGLMSLMFGGSENPKEIRRHLKASVEAYPANRQAYKTYVDWIESKLDDDRLTKPKQKPLLDELAQLMQKWSRALPDDVEPHLWLVDHLLENEQMEEAKPHVDWLAAARQDDPRVRATPWKWQLLEAMRLCRRKAWLSDVPARLDSAEKLWPAWLSRQWLPYLRAAVTLREGKKDEYERQRQQIGEESGLSRDSLADACMMLGAAQHMRVPAGELKPLRAPVDQAVKNLGRLPLEELLAAAGFFWDLHRTQLLYPAYRMHGGKFAKELLSRLSKDAKLVFAGINDESIHRAILWCSAHRFFSEGYELKLPNWYLKPDIAKHPMFAAARVNAYLKLSTQWRRDPARDLGSLLREAAPSQRDAYYRYWFVSLADELENVVARDSSSFFGGFNPFSSMFGGFDDDEDDDYEDDDFDEDLGFNPNCDCGACQAAKRAYEASRRR